MLYEITGSGLKRADVHENDSKNNLSIGTVLHLNGYNNPDYVIVKNLGISERFTSYGTTYLIISLDDFSQSRKQAYTLKYISQRTSDMIQTYIMDEIKTPEEVLTLWEHSEALRIARQETQERKEKHLAELEAQGRELFKKHIPEAAKALICAYNDVDDSEIQTDYFSHKTTEIVILGYSLNTRASFSEMRKCAGRIPETKSFEIAPLINSNNQPKTETNKTYWQAADEHRENYSMGAGYYLKNSWINSTGWRIQKQTKWHADWERDIYIAMAKRCIF